MRRLFSPPPLPHPQGIFSGAVSTSFVHTMDNHTYVANTRCRETSSVERPLWSRNEVATDTRKPRARPANSGGKSAAASAMTKGVDCRSFATWCFTVLQKPRPSSRVGAKMRAAPSGRIRGLIGSRLAPQGCCFLPRCGQRGNIRECHLFLAPPALPISPSVSVMRTPILWMEPCLICT